MGATASKPRHWCRVHVVAPRAVEQLEGSVLMHATTRNRVAMHALSRVQLAGICLIITMVVPGCNDGAPPAPAPPPFDTTTSPTSPSPTAAGAFIWAMVVDDAGVCIPGATFEVLRGPVAGAKIVQQTPCSVWDYDGGVSFLGLFPGVTMTLRASANGYCPMTKTVTAAFVAYGAVEFGLAPSPCPPEG